MVYSGIAEGDYPFYHSVTKYGYCARVEGETSFGERFVIAQHFYDDECALVLGKLPDFGWGTRQWACCTRNSYEDLKVWLHKQWAQGLNVMHCSCSGERFGAYALKGWGTAQSLFAGTYEFVRERIKEKWDDCSVTSVCPGIEHDWVVFMTKCSGDHLHGNSTGGQYFSIKSSWSDVNESIQEQWKKGMIVTALAISKGAWFLVMTDSPRAQNWAWGPVDGSVPNLKETFWDNGLDVTTIVKDPQDGRWLLIGTGKLNAANCRIHTGISN